MSDTDRPTLSPAAWLAMTRKPSPEAPRRPPERVANGGRVLFFPAPDGQVRIVGLGPRDEWIAEFSCLECDFREELLRRMERHVARKTGTYLTVVG